MATLSERLQRIMVVIEKAIATGDCVVNHYDGRIGRMTICGRMVVELLEPVNRHCSISWNGVNVPTPLPSGYHSLDRDEGDLLVERIAKLFDLATEDAYPQFERFIDAYLRP